MYESKRVLLRSYRENEAHLLVELDSDPRVMKYISDGKPTSLDEAQKTIDRLQNYVKFWNHHMGTFAAFQKSTNLYMGWFLLRPPKNNLSEMKNLELGYRLKHDFWGQGFGYEVSRVLVDKAFKKLKCETVFATAMAGNEGSIAVMKKVGLKWDSNYVEKEFLGADKNAVKYVITRDEWQAERKS